MDLSFLRRLVLCYLLSTFPPDDDALNSFQRLKDDLAKACLGAIADDLPFEVKTDASDFALAAILSQDGLPVAFISPTLTSCERRYPAVEKEACAIIEAVRRWKHYLKGRHFSLVTDQQAISFTCSISIIKARSKTQKSFHVGLN